MFRWNDGKILPDDTVSQSGRP